VRAAEHLRVLLVRTHAAGSWGVHAEPRGGVRRSGRRARQPDPGIPHRGRAAPEAAPGILSRHVPRLAGAAPGRPHQGAYRRRGRAPRTPRADERARRPDRAAGRRSHQSPGGRRGSVQSCGARHHSGQETVRRGVARRPSRGAPAGHSLELHHAVRPRGDDGGPRGPPARAAGAPGRDQRVPHLHPPGVPPGPQRAGGGSGQNRHGHHRLRRLEEHCRGAARARQHPARQDPLADGDAVHLSGGPHLRVRRPRGHRRLRAGLPRGRRRYADVARLRSGRLPHPRGGVERDSLYRTVRTFEDWAPTDPGRKPGVPGVPGVRPQGPEGPTFQISHRPRARARGQRELPVLSAVDGAE